MTTPTLEQKIHALGQRARVASRKLAQLSSAQKNAALEGIAVGLEQNMDALLDANARDIESAKKSGLSPALIDRLTLNPQRIAAMARGVRDVAALPDPCGEILREWTRPNGLRITKLRTPIGVVGIIYESRPNVTCDAAVLCIKAGNAALLRGGSEAIHSNIAIAEAMQRGGEPAGLPKDSALLISDTDREGVAIMARMDKFLDVIVPRGGHALIEAVVQNARMPVIKHFHGVCIAYLHQDADLELAEKIVVNAKCQRPGVCNAIETLLVDRSIVATILPRVANALRARKVVLRCDEEALAIVGPPSELATAEDWTTEYLDLILAVRVVANLDEAIEHINHFGSHHSDVIVTRNEQAAERFLAEVDSATVYWNASTRFTDGGEFGFGAEIGISTDKLHARGPMALEELTTYKYILRGNGQIRE